jgi:hypothetical protein
VSGNIFIDWSSVFAGKPAPTETAQTIAKIWAIARVAALICAIEFGHADNCASMLEIIQTAHAILAPPAASTNKH